MIRGDIAPMGCQVVSKTAARAGDTLRSGAFAALAGVYGMTPQLTAAAISADSGGAIATLGGANLSEEVANNSASPVLTNATFLRNSAQIAASQFNGTQERRAATNTAYGELGINTGSVVTGYTSY